ncbi:MAG TPA: ribonuclease Z, partial [Bacillus bacterium]|nr:ribonuclease Z [Bacillus sp. (in: firmicutes)]
TLQAADTALKAGVKKLCLTHISSRYDRGDWKMLEDEAGKIFANTVISEDFMEISIPLKIIE